MPEQVPVHPLQVPLQLPLHVPVQLLPHPPEQVAEQVPVQLVQAPEQLPPQAPLQVVEHPEQPLDSDVPVQELMQLEEHSAVQSAQPLSLEQLERIAGKAPDTARMPKTGRAFLAASLKNSLLFCRFFSCMWC